MTTKTRSKTKNEFGKFKRCGKRRMRMKKRNREKKSNKKERIMKVRVPGKIFEAGNKPWSQENAGVTQGHSLKNVISHCPVNQNAPVNLKANIFHRFH